MRYDVVIVGGGPAGSTTAKYAAMGGASVLLLEKRQEIGSPVRCGEGIAREWIDEVGIKLDRKWISHEVEGAKVVAPNGSHFCINERIAGDEVGTVIERDIFDRTLVEDAIRAGADVMVKTAVIDLIKSEGVEGVIAKSPQGRMEIHAGCVVGADGFESQVGRWGGIDTTLRPRDVTSCLQYRMANIEPDPDYCEFILGSGAPGGYIWVFPKGEESANVGLGMQLSKLKKKGELRYWLDKYLEKDERLRGGRIIEVVSGAVSTCAPIDRTVADGLLLVGDAARQIDPVTGGGIANACKAAKIAGEVLAEAAQARDFSEQMLMKYEKGWRNRFEEALYRNWMAKEKLVTLSDEVFDMIIETLSRENLDHLSVLNILKVIQREHPELVEEFMDLI
ncbi:MAG: NAD(P)/FAD-dependent oxidoreductase [Thermoplasmata archaeon]